MRQLSEGRTTEHVNSVVTTKFQQGKSGSNPTRKVRTSPGVAAGIPRSRASIIMQITSNERNRRF